MVLKSTSFKDELLAGRQLIQVIVDNVYFNKGIHCVQFTIGLKILNKDNCSAFYSCCIDLIKGSKKLDTTGRCMWVNDESEYILRWVASLYLDEVEEDSLELMYGMDCYEFLNGINGLIIRTNTFVDRIGFIDSKLIKSPVIKGAD